MTPDLKTEIPGPKSRELTESLRETESHNVTYADEQWPIFWKKAEGVNVWDEDGNRFLDLTSAFGVAGLGHGRAEIVQAMKKQSDELLHGMGDVHPTRLKSELCAKLSELTFERWVGERGKVLLSNSGFEAVESALKTARLVSGKKGVLSFENGYHGLGYGSLLGGGFQKFREPFADQLAEVGVRVAFPVDEAGMSKLAHDLKMVEEDEIGALLVEPIQGRGGKNVPPRGFLNLLRQWCDENGVVLIFDEIYTGFNRTGHLFACEDEGVFPDVICMGKAMSGGYPISACVGRAEVMDAWPISTGEALHTSTFLGNPVGCAMALAAMKIHARDEVRQLVNDRGAKLEKMLRSIQSEQIREVRGRGLMWGMELTENAGAKLASFLKRGIILLADGEEGKVLAFTPPFLISDEEIDFVGEILAEELR